MKPKVTIVVSTYNRPQLLRWTIESILHQTYENWLLLIIGDRCSPETAELVASFGDERIFFVNLQERCGEQSGPNTVGMHAAFTEYVAFANHDDIWLPDHLGKAVALLDAGDIEFYCSGAAITTFATKLPQKVGGYCVLSASPKRRTIEQAFYNSAVFFEPVSCWVMKRNLRRKVGPWNPAHTLYRTPLENWILRAWRADIECYFSDEITVIYCNGEKAKEKRAPDTGPMYNMGDEEAEYWTTMLQDKGVKAFRLWLVEQAANPPWKTTLFAPPMSGTMHQWVFDALVTPETAKIFKEFGWDAYDKAGRLSGRSKGSRLNTILNRRTGETLQQAKKDWREAVFFVTQQLAANKLWQDFRN